MKIRWHSPFYYTSLANWLYDSFYTYYDVDQKPMDKRGIFNRLFGFEWVVYNA